MTERAGQTVEPVEAAKAVEAQKPGEAAKRGQTTGAIRAPEAEGTMGPVEAVAAQEPPELTGPDDSTLRIYVACLAAYNAGHLHGRWIDATQDADAIRGEIEAMLRVSPIPLAEEFAIHDYEGFKGAKISHYTGIAEVADLAAFIEEHGKLGAELFQYFDGDMDEAAAALEDHAGQFKSLGHFAAELTEDSSDVPVHLALYIDYDAMGRDMELSGDIFTIQTGFECVDVFWAR